MNLSALRGSLILHFLHHVTASHSLLFPTILDDAYAAQMLRDREQHLAREELLVEQAVRRARYRREREQGERRGPGRPRWLTDSSTVPDTASIKRSRRDWLASPELFAQIDAAVQQHRSYKRAMVSA